MDLKRLRYFCTVAEQGQISRAAKVLHIAQPPLSQRLQELEEELGSTLFIRKGRGLQLTEAGALLYRRGREILHAVEATRDEVIRAGTQIEPALRIGLSPTCKRFWLGRFERLRAAFAGRQIGLVVGDSSYLEHLLRIGELDVALMQPPLQMQDLQVRPVTASPTVALFPRQLFAQAKSSLTLAELGQHPLLLLRRSVGVGSYERLLHCFHEAGLNPDVALYSSDVDPLLDVLREGFAGIAVIPETEARRMGEAFCICPIAMDLPDYRLSLVSPLPAKNPEVFEKLLALLAQ